MDGRVAAGEGLTVHPKSSGATFQVQVSEFQRLSAWFGPEVCRGALRCGFRSHLAGCLCRLPQATVWLPGTQSNSGKNASERSFKLSNIGFIGLGIMGNAMAKNLLKAGHSLVVFDIVPELLDRVVAAGAARGASCSDVAARSEIVITMLPDGPEVEQAILGPSGVLEGARPGTSVADMSSISPLVAQKVGAACAAKNIEFLDAP